MSAVGTGGRSDQRAPRRASSVVVGSRPRPAAASSGTALLPRPIAIEQPPVHVGSLRASPSWVEALQHHGSAALKRGYDVVASLVALIVLIPVLFALVVAIRLSSPGPAIFRQERIGRSGRTFTCLKFRTMHQDAPERLEQLLGSDAALQAEWAATHKLKRDPRITRVGAFLRRTSLDELPQLVNVIRGDMSIVGPRPIVEPERVRYGPAMGTVLSVRPGLTGLWQVSGRNDTSYRQRVALDLRYVETRTVGGDLVICLRTAVQMLGWWRNGAY
jgi:exopolysaccharide production protein ExoY